jgi:hypothetical protein
VSHGFPALIILISTFFPMMKSTVHTVLSLDPCLWVSLVRDDHWWLFLTYLFKDIQDIFSDIGNQNLVGDEVQW